MTEIETEIETETDRWTKYVDSVAKLVAAGAIVVAAWVAQRYESRSNSLSLLNQREQSETQLRASMFQNLIEPIVGAKGGTDIAADREELLIELLTLNFHDHFEFKPLLVRVDQRLAANHLDANRRELSSIARRVIDRQLNMLTAVPTDLDTRQASVTTFTFYFSPNKSVSPKKSGDESKPKVGAGSTCEGNDCQTCEGKACQVSSPDRQWQVSVTVLKIDLDAQTVTVSVMWQPTPTCALDSVSAETKKLRGLDFDLTQFDFPLTDYTQPDDQHRFAISLFELGRDRGVMKIVWFPFGYITERERPFDFHSMKE